MVVLLVAPPVSKSQRLLYTPEIEAVFQPYVRRLEKAHQCRFIDCRDRLTDALFYDNHHLLTEGGAAFTRLLTREVFVPFWCEIRNGPALQEAVRD
jgi:hypothetical protein